MASVTPLISQEEKDFQAKRWEGVHRLTPQKTLIAPR